MMKRKMHFVLCALGGVAIIGLLVAAVMGLWNWIVPGITGWTSITYWQALGLALLLRLLTGFHPPMFPLRGRRHMHEKMRRMSMAERRAFIHSQLHKLTGEEGGDE